MKPERQNETLHGGNGGGESAGSATSRLFEKGKAVRAGAAEIAGDARDLASLLRDIAAETEAALVENLEARPYLTLAAAAGAGYVLGGGLPSRLTTLLLGIGGRVALASLAQQLVFQAERQGGSHE